MAIADVVNEALKQAKGKIIDAVNWNDLRCTDVIKHKGQYIAFIEEADPNAYELQIFVREYLEKKGYENVGIITNW